jgi:hypothetical protein
LPEAGFDLGTDAKHAVAECIEIETELLGYATMMLDFFFGIPVVVGLDELASFWGKFGEALIERGEPHLLLRVSEWDNSGPGFRGIFVTKTMACVLLQEVTCDAESEGDGSVDLSVGVLRAEGESVHGNVGEMHRVVGVIDAEEACEARVELMVGDGSLVRVLVKKVEQGGKR